jgi:hypothetical protein
MMVYLYFDSKYTPVSKVDDLDAFVLDFFPFPEDLLRTGNGYYLDGKLVACKIEGELLWA